jgi:PleD family two-component response regulator
VLLPGTDAAGGEAVLASLAELIEVNNQYYPDLALSISTGIATSRPGDRLEQVVKRADMKMLHAKRLYYLQANRDRRGTGTA